MAEDYLDRLSRFVTETSLEDLDGSTVSAAKTVVLDTIGAVLAGCRLPENANFAELAQGMSNAGPATLFGHRGKVQPPFAALVNATAGVALEMDEGSRLGGGHPSIHVAPGAIAVAEGQGAGGKELLESLVVGYEVTSRIGSGTTPRPDIHSHGTWGTIGTAAATAKLLGFDASETRQAMNMAMSMSPANSWTPCLEGATVRNLYPGRSGFQGILAAHLVRCGFTGITDGPRDLYTAILGNGFDAEAVLDGLGEPGGYRIQRNYFKLHACCLYNHPALDAVQAMVRREKFLPSEVDRIKVEAPSVAMILDDPAPQNMLAAKFSIPYAVAAALLHGTTDITAFYPEKVQDSRVGALAQRVELVEDPQMDLTRYDYPSSRVEVRLDDGRVFNESVTAHHGDTHNPASRDELVGKFTFLALDSLGEEGTHRVVDAVDRLDRLDGVKELTGILAQSRA
jgi:2-methylcitrate dehydratase PrpD